MWSFSQMKKDRNKAKKLPQRNFEMRNTSHLKETEISAI